jgi:hypothetical protein
MDTSPEAAEIVRQAILRTAPADRIRHAFELSEQIRELSLSRLRMRYPSYSTLQLVEILIGESLIPRSRSETSQG